MASCAAPSSRSGWKGVRHHNGLYIAATGRWIAPADPTRSPHELRLLRGPVSDEPSKFPPPLFGEERPASTE